MTLLTRSLTHFVVINRLIHTDLHACMYVALRGRTFFVRTKN